MLGCHTTPPDSSCPSNVKIQLAHTVMDHMTSAAGGPPVAYVDGSYKPGTNNAGSLTILALQTTL